MDGDGHGVTETVTSAEDVAYEEQSWEKMSEADFQRKVRSFAEANGWRVFTTWNSRNSPAGEPDLRLVRERVIWAELKKQIGTTSALQESAILALQQAQQEVYVWRPSDWEEIVQRLGPVRGWSDADWLYWIGRPKPAEEQSGRPAYMSDIPGGA